MASALNLAIEKMSGEYFSWLSHDDLYTPEKLSRQVAVLAALGQEDAVVYSDYAVFADDPAVSHTVRLRGVLPGHFRHWITIENQLHGCTLLIPRRAFDKVGVFNINLRTTQDYDLWFRMAAEFQFVHVPEVLVKARSHPDQGSHKMADIALSECNALLSNFIERLAPEEIVTATGLPLAAAYMDMAVSMYRRGFDVAGKLADYMAAQQALLSGPASSEVTLRQASRVRDRIYNMGRRVLPRPLKRAIKSITRPLAAAYSGSRDNAVQLRDKFTEVYEKNIFGGRISRSGEGSDLVQTAVIRRELPRIVQDYGIRTFLDAPCGDWYWMKGTRLGVERYIGADIVTPMIEKNRQLFGDEIHDFRCLNLAQDDLPKADLIFCRDCLVHLSFADSLQIVANFRRSGARFLLTTTFTNRTGNNDLVGVDSFWRPLNLCKAPFNFPEPLLLINEECTEEAGQYGDKCLGLWLLESLPV